MPLMLICICLVCFLTGAVKAQEPTFPDVGPEHDDIIAKLIAKGSELPTDALLRAKIDQIVSILSQSGVTPSSISLGHLYHEGRGIDSDLLGTEANLREDDTDDEKSPSELAAIQQGRSVPDARIEGTLENSGLVGSSVSNVVVGGTLQNSGVSGSIHPNVVAPTGQETTAKTKIGSISDAKITSPTWSPAQSKERNIANSGTVVGKPAYIRDYPSSEGDIVAELDENDRLSVLLRHGDWYAVTLPDQRLGYIFRDLLRIHGQTATLFDGAGASKSISSVETAIAPKAIAQPDIVGSAADAASPPEVFVSQPIVHATAKDLRTAVDELAETAKEEIPVFSRGAFQCRSDLQKCRSRYGFLDCELTMIACVISSIGG